MSVAVLAARSRVSQMGFSANPWHAPRSAAPKQTVLIGFVPIALRPSDWPTR